MPKKLDDAQIYRDSMQAVIRYGYAGATTKRLAQAAGIGEVTLFRKYGTKAQLVQQAMAALAAEYDFEGQVRYTGDLQADLLRVVTAYQHSAEQDGRFFYTILVEAARHPELADVLDTLKSRIQVVGRLFARYQAEGVLKPEHPLHTLVGLIGPLIAMNMLKAAANDLLMPPLDLKNHVALFIAGHRTQP